MVLLHLGAALAATSPWCGPSRYFTFVGISWALWRVRYVCGQAGTLRSCAWKLRARTQPAFALAVPR